MGLFGPLGAAIYGGLFHEVSGDVYGFGAQSRDSTTPFVPQQPRSVPNRYLLAPDDTSADPNAGAAAPSAANPVAPQAAALPAMQTLGAFSTRRMQLFGPLGGISI